MVYNSVNKVYICGVCVRLMGQLNEKFPKREKRLVFCGRRGMMGVKSTYGFSNFG